MRKTITTAKNALDIKKPTTFETQPNPAWAVHMEYLTDFLEYMDGRGLVLTDDNLIEEATEEWLENTNPPKI